MSNRSFAAMLVLLSLALVASPVAAQMYKHVDEKGKITYSDRPQAAKQETIKVDNTKRTGDRSSAINANTARDMAEREERWNRDLKRKQDAKAAHDRLEAKKNAKPAEMARVRRPVYVPVTPAQPDPRDSTR